MGSHVWISIQSDAGLTLGELGKLSSTTDSHLIASTLMALKDIVSIEASSGESQFMTGDVESSSFGTFAIPINEQSKLILSYIISTDAGGTIDDTYADLVQSLCNHLGKQLTQFSFISVFTSSGEIINRTILTKAFVNACTLVKMENNVSPQERVIQSGYQEIIQPLLIDPSRLLEAYRYILGEKWEKSDEKWVDGLLVLEEKEALYLGIAEYVLFLFAHENPVGLLYSSNPRLEQRKILEMLREQVVLIENNSHDLIIAELPNSIKSGIKGFIGRLSITEMHRVQKLLFDKFVRDAYVSVIKKNPLTAFMEPEIGKIQEQFSSFLPTTEYEHIGTILLAALANTQNERQAGFIHSFFDGFIKELSEERLSQSAMAFLVSFAQQFVTGKQLRDELESNLNIKKSWLRDINKHISPKSAMKSIKQLRVDSIYEALLLTNATGFSIVNTIATILSDQLLIKNGRVGYILEQMINFYRSMGTRIKASSIIVSILEQVSELQVNVDLATPLYKDIIGALLSGGSHFIQDGDGWSGVERKKGSIYVSINQESIPLVQYISENENI
ncbi:MAG: hypothetical protein ACW98K_01330, partial [Candidatus Kariarchaeaceae archaeon]